jgi:HK97 gp10 family phage protein
VAEFDVDVAEIRRFERDIEVGAVQAARQVRDTVRKAVFETEARGKAKAAVDTGFMRGSITSDFRGSNADVAQGETGPDASYASFVEHGTSRQAPQPFMGPAADEVEPTFYAALENIDPLAGA